MAEYRTVTAVATVTQQIFNADGTVSTNTFDVTAEAGKVVAIDPYITIEQTEDGAVVTVTDAHGTTTATIYNGKDGADYVLTAADKTDIADIVYGLLTDADNTAYGGA